MPLPSFWNTGTASVANGDTTVTFSVSLGTADAPVIQAGDFFLDPAQPLVPQQRIETIDYDAGTAELAVNWPGTTMVAAPYEVRFVGDSVRSSAQTRRLLEQLSVVTANGRGLFFTFDDATVDADPGAGKFRFNNATIASATAAYVDNLDADGATVSSILDTWDDTGATGGRGQLWVRSIATPSTFAAFNVTGSVVDGTGYRKLTLSYIGASGSLATDEQTMLAFSAAGVQGAAGDDGNDGSDGANGLNAGIKYTFNSSTSNADPGSGKLAFNNAMLSSATALYISETDADSNGISGLLATWDDSTNTVKGSLHVEKDGAPGTFADFNVTGTLTDNGTWGTLTVARTAGNGSLSNGDTLRARFTRAGDKGANGAGTVSSVVPGTGVSVDSTDPANPVVSLSSGGTREKLATDRTYYAATTGSDSNTGRETATTHAVTFTNSSANIGWTSHGRSVGDVIALSTTGTLPTNFLTTRLYYVKTVVDANTITVAVTAGGTAVTAGSAGSGTHTATLLAPFLTPQKAYDVIADSLDLGAATATIQVAGGTYSPGSSAVLFIARPWVGGKGLGGAGSVGGGSVHVKGDETTPSNVIMSAGASSKGIFINCPLPGVLDISGVKFTGTSDGVGIFNNGGAVVNIGKVDFGDMGTGFTMHMWCAQAGVIFCYSQNYTISGSASHHAFAEVHGAFDIELGMITCSGTPAWGTSFCRVESGAVFYSAATWSGASTGKRFIVRTGGAIRIFDTSFAEVGSAALTTLPGDAAGDILGGGSINEYIAAIAGTANEISVANPNNGGSVQTLSLPTALTFTGKTVTGGTFASPTAITGLPNPSSAQDAATKAYVDNVAAGLDIKPSARAATTANITLSGAQTIDGVSVIAGDRVLVKNQSTASQNGIYVAASGSWARATDMDAWTEVPGACLWVEEGTSNADTAWVCTANQGGTIGSTSVTWTQFGGTGAFQAASANLTSWAAVTRASGFDTFAATPSSANLAALLTDETGSGAAVFASAPTLTNPVVGTQSILDNSTKGASTAYVDRTTREKLSGNRTYYVRSDGSDSNTGLTNSSGGAYATLQKAWNTILTLDLGGNTATIEIGASGTLTGALSIVAAPVGGNVVIQGNTSTAANYIISTTSADAINVFAAVNITVKNLKIQTTTGGNGINAQFPGAVVVIENVTFGAIAGTAALFCQQNALITCTTSMTIAASNNAWAWAQLGGIIAFAGPTVTLSGTPAWTTAGVVADTSGIVSLFSTTFSGSATGKRFQGTLNGMIQSYGAGTASTYFPGNSNGTTATGGQQA